MGKFHLKLYQSSYGIAPKVCDGQKPRIEVFNPVDEQNKKKTSTTILFDNNGNFIDFGSKAQQKYAEIIDDDETAMLFQTVRLFLLIKFYIVQNGPIS